MASGYDPRRSNVKEDALAEFIRAPITGDLTEVPGIGPAAAANLGNGDEPVTTTYQLIGKFMMLKGNGVESREHCDRFWTWLQGKGINSYRSGIVQCIAEKCNILMPGIYDEELFK